MVSWQHCILGAKKKYKDKMDELKNKMNDLKRQEQDLVDNLSKFNTFVKEKKLKVERAIKTEKEEKALRDKMTKEIDDKEDIMKELTIAKVLTVFQI